MRIVTYTNEEIRQNINEIVFVKMDFSSNRFETIQVKIEKITAKQFNAVKPVKKIVRFSDVGLFSSYYCGYFLNEDVEVAVKEFKTKEIEKLENKIRNAKKEIKKIKSIEIGKYTKVSLLFIINR